MSEEPLMNNESIKRIIHGNVLLGDEVKRLREEKEAMLKHIDDLENGLSRLMNLWLSAADYSDFDKAVGDLRDKFAYLETDEDGDE
jgi:DNA mismatch repair ATPase MutS